MRDLGTLGHPECGDVPGSDCSNGEAADINDRGEVVGLSYNDAWIARPFVWRGSELRDLGVLPGEDAAALRINERGQIAGMMGRNWDRAFFWDNGIVTEIGSLGGGTWVTALGEDGTVVGSSLTAAGERHAFVWKDGRMTDLGAGPSGAGQSHAYGINAAGDVIGWSSSSSDRWAEYRGLTRATLWRVTRPAQLAGR
jgi:probable HAF family extracellular repeat protein